MNNSRLCYTIFSLDSVHEVWLYEKHWPTLLSMDDRMHNEGVPDYRLCKEYRRYYSNEAIVNRYPILILVSFSQELGNYLELFIQLPSISYFVEKLYFGIAMRYYINCTLGLIHNASIGILTPLLSKFLLIMFFRTLIYFPFPSRNNMFPTRGFLLCLTHITRPICTSIIQKAFITVLVSGLKNSDSIIDISVQERIVTS